MLKKDLENKLYQAEERIKTLSEISESQDARIRKLNDDKIELGKVKRNVDKALCAIEALTVFACKNEVNPSDAYMIQEQARNEGREIPDIPPPSDISVALRHVEYLLRKPTKKDENSILGHRMSY